MGSGWAQLGYYGLTRSDPEWDFWCKTHANPTKNPLWVLSGHNVLTHLKPEQDPLGLAIRATVTLTDRGSGRALEDQI